MHCYVTEHLWNTHHHKCPHRRFALQTSECAELPSWMQHALQLYRTGLAAGPVVPCRSPHSLRMQSHLGCDVLVWAASTRQ
jgi:hypothetical protein